MPRKTRNTTQSPAPAKKALFWPRLLLVALVCAGIAWVLRLQLFSLDAAFYDTGIVSKPPRPMDKVMIVGIDQEFMAGRHPYLAPRDRVARVLRAVVAAHPRAVAVDVYLDSRLDHGPKGQDAQLREALVEANQQGVPVVLSDIAPQTGEQLGGQGQLTGTTARGSVVDYFSEVASTGDVLMEIGPDGVVRQLQPFGPLPPMSYLLAMRSGAPRDWDLFRRRGENEPLPLDFHGPPGSIPSVSASALLRTPALAGMLGLQDKVVIIGATYEESRDLMLTPYSTRGRASTEESGKPVESSGYYRPFYGVELLATATQTIMDGALRQSHEGFDAETVDFTLLLLVCAGVILLARRGVAAGVSVALTVLGGSAALAIYSALVAPDASWIAGLLGHRFHPAGPFWIGAPLAAAAGIAWRQMDQARELQQVREAFGAYVGSEILENLGGRMPELGGEVQPIAVLFCDIRGYSALAERMRDDPKTLMAELNDHFHPLVNTLKARGAYVDNYVGDLVMALFGAPTGGNVTDAARQAARAALDFVDVVHKRNEKRREQGLPAIEIGVGVHCGEAVVGNLGSLDGGGGKIHYTAIGDTVNLASRVESSTRKYEVPLLVTEELVNACRAGSPDDGLHLPEWEFVAETTVKGRETPVRLYRPKS